MYGNLFDKNGQEFNTGLGGMVACHATTQALLSFTDCGVGTQQQHNGTVLDRLPFGGLEHFQIVAILLKFLRFIR